MSAIIALLVILSTAFVIRWLRFEDPKPIFNVYRRPNRWYPIKYAIILGIIGLRKLYVRYGQHWLIRIETSAGYGVKSKPNAEEMEKLQTLPEDSPLAVDAVYFAGASKSECFFTAGIARRPNDVADAFWILKIPTVGLLMSPKFPETTLTSDRHAFGAEGLVFEPVKPMKLWNIKYDGRMRLQGVQNRRLQVTMDLQWSSDLAYFDCNTDVDWRILARAIAREPWSREYFENLRRSHQNHYEQMGCLHGTVKIEGYGEHFLDMNCMRDHSYAAKRDWKSMHRYAMHNGTINDGMKFAVGIVSHPDMFSELEFGYVYTPTGQLMSIESCHLDLYRHGEQGTPPTDYAFSFRAGGKDYAVQCEVLDSPEIYIGTNWEARVIERMCRFKVNGRLGWGFAEWEYRHQGGRQIKSEESSFDNSFEDLKLEDK